MTVILQFTLISSFVFALQHKAAVNEMAVRTERSAVIAKLISIAGNNIDNNLKGEAAESIRILGIYRAKESIPLLVKHIGFTPLGIVTERPFRLSESLPCVYALSKIGGRECNDAVIGLVAESGTDDNILYARVVLTISLGYDDAVALTQSRAAREKDGVKANRLRSLAKSVEKDSRNTTYDE